MIKNIVFAFLLLLLSISIFAGCAGVSSTMKDGYKFEEIYSVGWFTPTYQYKKVSKCATETRVNDLGFEEVKTVEPCVQIGQGGEDGFTIDVAGPMAPAVIGGASGVVAGALLADGIRDSGDTVNNSNSVDQNQSQRQRQRAQGGGCRGNCR